MTIHQYINKELEMAIKILRQNSIHQNNEPHLTEDLIDLRTYYINYGKKLALQHIQQKINLGEISS